MNYGYENQGTNTFLVYEIREDDVLDTMSLGMLTNNQIEGFAQTLFTQMDDEKYVKFNVSAKVTADQLFDGTVSKRRLVGVFSGIVGAMLSAEEYMLDANNVLLDLEHIFVDVTTYETAMICLPVIGKDIKNSDLSAFFKTIMFNTQFDQTENCDYVAQIINFLNRHPVLPLEEFKKVLEGIAKGDEPAKVAQVKMQPEAPRTVQQNASPVHVAPTPVVSTAKQVEVKPDKTEKAETPEPEEKPMSLFYLLQHYNKDNAATYKAQKEARKAKKAGDSSPDGKQKNNALNPGYAVPGYQTVPTNYGFAVPGQADPQVKQNVVPQAVVSEARLVAEHVQSTSPSAISFGETTVLGGGGIGETTVLGSTTETSIVAPHLIRTKNNEKIPINKPVFRIGKERSYVDYFIGDNTAISRSHANIVNHNGEFYVVDTNSTNHTYVNGGMIQSNVETKLSHGTKIRLANEDFEFRLY